MIGHACRSSVLRWIGRSTLVLIVALGLSPVPTHATTQTAQFSVNVTVQSACLISATTLAFTAYTGAVDNATATISITCTNTTSYNVGLDAGLNGASVTTRQMANGGILVNYGLFKDASHATNWGQTVNTDTVSGTGNGSAQSMTVYGQIPAGQYATPQTYSDTITATVTY